MSVVRAMEAVRAYPSDGEWIREMVWAGEFSFTASGLTKGDLIMKNGRTMSKKASRNDKKHP